MKNLLIILILCLSSTIYSQKLKSTKVTYPFLSMAKQPLQARFETYSVKINSLGYSLDKLDLKKDELVAKYFKLEKYQHVEEHGDLEMIVTLGAGPIKSNKIVINKGKLYVPEIVYVLPLKIAFKDGKRDLIFEQVINNGTDAKSQSFGYGEKNANNAKKYWEREQHSEIPKLLAKNYLQEFVKLRLSLSVLDDRMDTDRANFYYIKDADKFAVEVNDDFIDDIKSSFKDITKDLNVSAAKERLSSAILIFEKHLDSPIKEIAFMANYNLSLSYLIIEDFEKANELISKCKSFDLEKSDVEDLQEEIEKRILLVQKSIINEDIYESKFDESKVMLSEVEDMATGEKIEIRDYVISKDGTKTMGVLHISGLLGGVVSSIDIDTKAADQVRMTRVKEEEISEVYHDGKEYVVREFKKSGNLSKRFYCLLKVYSNGEYMLVESTTKNLNSKNANYSPYYIYTPEEVYELSDFHMLNFNKGVANNFPTCQNIVDKAELKIYGRRDEVKLKELIDDLVSCKSN